MSIVSFHCVPRIVQLCYIFVVRGRTDFEHLEIFVNKPVRYWHKTSKNIQKKENINRFTLLKELNAPKIASPSFHYRLSKLGMN